MILINGSYSHKQCPPNHGTDDSLTEDLFGFIKDSK